MQFKYLMHSSSVDLSEKGKKVIFSKSEKISKKSRNNGRGLCCRASYISISLFKAQNPRLINESGFKSRAANDGARTVCEIHCYLSANIFCVYYFSHSHSVFVIEKLKTIHLP